MVGLAALLWVRGQVGFVTVPEPIARRVVARPSDATPVAVAPAPVEGGVVEAMVGPGGPAALSRAGTQPSGAPSTTAAFRPPNPNEVDSTRR